MFTKELLMAIHEIILVTFYTIKLSASHGENL